MLREHVISGVNLNNRFKFVLVLCTKNLFRKMIFKTDRFEHLISEDVIMLFCALLTC